MFVDEEHILALKSDKLVFALLKHYPRTPDVRIGEALLQFPSEAKDCKARRIELEVKPDKPSTQRAGSIAIEYQFLSNRS